MESETKNEVENFETWNTKNRKFYNSTKKIRKG